MASGLILVSNREYFRIVLQNLLWTISCRNMLFNKLNSSWNSTKLIMNGSRSKQSSTRYFLWFHNGVYGRRQWCWWHRDFGDLKLITICRCGWHHLVDGAWRGWSSSTVDDQKANTVTNILQLSPTDFVSIIHHQRRWNQLKFHLRIQHVVIWMSKQLFKNAGSQIKFLQIPMVKIFSIY